MPKPAQRRAIRWAGAFLLASLPAHAADEALTARLLDRPLFAPTRRPHTTATPTPVAAREPEPRLMGIMIAGPVRLAVFAPLEGKPLVLREGEQVGRYRIDLIAARHVDLEGPSGRRVVIPKSDPVLRDAPATLPLINPYRREAQTENDQ